jgi:hypothetical protein
MIGSMLLVALLQTGAPASAAVPASAAAPAPAATNDVAWLREHLTALVDARAAKVGGPKMADNDPRLGVLHAMLRAQAANPGLPLPAYVRDAKTLEELWARSTAAFTINLMVQVAQARPPKTPVDAAACGRLCDGIVRASGDDTVSGLSQGGWPMPPESAAAIRQSATLERASCVEWCAKYPVPNAECVEKIRSQADLMTCWKAP